MANEKTEAAAAAAAPSPRPDRDAFLRRLEERQRGQEGWGQQQEEEEGPASSTAPAASPGGRSPLKSTGGSSSTSGGSPMSPVVRGTRKRPSGIPPPTLRTPTSAKKSSGSSGSPVASPQNGANAGSVSESSASLLSAKPAPAPAKAVSTEATAGTGTGIGTSTDSAAVVSAAKDPAILETPEDYATVLQYLAACGISLTADMGIFAPGGKPTANCLESAFDPASLKALLDLGRQDLRQRERAGSIVDSTIEKDYEVLQSMKERVETGTSAQDDVKRDPEKSFEEMRLEEYNRRRGQSVEPTFAFRTRSAGAAAPAAAVPIAEGSRGPATTLEDDDSTMPPLREVLRSSGGGEGAAASGRSFARQVSALSSGTSASVIGSIRTDATTAGSKQAAEEAPDKEEEDEDEEGIVLSTLEPWQRLLFRKIDKQSRLLRENSGLQSRVQQLEYQVEALQQQLHRNPNLLSLQGESPVVHLDNWMDERTRRAVPMPQNRDDAVQMIREMHHTPTPTVTLAPNHQELAARDGAPAVPPGANTADAPQQPQNHFIILSLLEMLFDGVMSIFTFPYQAGLLIASYISATRPVRILRHVYEEAGRRGVLRQFNLGLIFKFIFVSAILAGRTGGSRRRKHSNAASTGVESGWQIVADLWDEHRLLFLVSGTLFALLVQTGVVKLLWDIIMKEENIRRIWTGEDRMAEEHDAAGQVEEVGAPAARDDGQRANGANAVEEERDGQPPAAARLARRPVIPQQPGFFGGGIEPVPPDRGFSAIGFVADVLYLLGSFVFSLIPAWNPEQIRHPEPEPSANEDGTADPNNGGGNDNAEGDNQQAPLQDTTPEVPEEAPAEERND